MKTLSKLAAIAVVALSTGSAFAYEYDGTPPTVIGLQAPSTTTRAAVRAELAAPRVAVPYLVDGMTPASYVPPADGGVLSRQAVREETRIAVRNAHAPVFIGG